MIIVCDIDSVVTQTNPPIIKFIEKRFGIKVEYNEIKNKKLEKLLTPKQAKQTLNFINTHEFYFNLKPLPGAIAGLQALKKEGKTIIMSSARPAKFTDTSAQWFHEHGAPFDEMICGRKKVEVIREYQPRIFIDDDVDEHRPIKQMSDRPPELQQILNIKPWSNFITHSYEYLRAWGWKKEFALPTITERIQEIEKGKISYAF